jgi:hypothetical protein
MPMGLPTSCPANNQTVLYDGTQWGCASVITGLPTCTNGQSIIYSVGTGSWGCGSPIVYTKVNSPWSSCSKTCGTGTQKFTTTCIGSDGVGYTLSHCGVTGSNGLLTQMVGGTQSCNTQSCTIATFATTGLTCNGAYCYFDTATENQVCAFNGYSNSLSGGLPISATVTPDTGGHNIYQWTGTTWVLHQYTGPAGGNPNPAGGYLDQLGCSK